MTDEAATPEWWRGAVLYQIYPRSFRDLDGDGVGDLAGILEKLDYVASLGVDGVWLSPFFASPMKDFGYDVSDYRAVDPLFGTMADFDAVLAKAHALGLKVIIDQVWSHTSDQHPWFIESAAARDGDKADWYVWADAKADGSPPNNWQAVFGGPSWSWSPRRRQYYLHNFLESQPDLNFWNPAVRAAILDVACFWLDRGVDGFRLDVINFIFHDKALTDNPAGNHRRPPATPTLFQRHVHDRSQPEALAFMGELRGLVDAYSDRMLVGEIVDDPPLPRQQEYTAGTDRLHTAYSFYFLSATQASPALFGDALAAWEGVSGWPSWSLGNHDVARFASRLASKGGPAQARILMAALLCLRGTIFLYQGEELGLPQAKVPFDRLRDPFDIAAWPGGAGRDGARTPMPWTGEGGTGGFSLAADAWLPFEDAHRPLNAAAQEADPDSLLQFTRRLLALRRSLPALRHGSAALRPAPPGVLAFERGEGEERCLCVFELGGETARQEVGQGSRLMAAFAGAELAGVALALPPYGGAILKIASF